MVESVGTFRYIRPVIVHVDPNGPKCPDTDNHCAFIEAMEHDGLVLLKATKNPRDSTAIKKLFVEANKTRAAN